MATLQDIVQGADDKIESIENAIEGVDQQIADLEEQETSMTDTLNQINSEVLAFLDATAVGDWTFTHSDYYSGTPLSIDDNVSDWENYSIIDSSPTYSDATSVIVVDESPFEIGDSIYFRGATNSYPIPMGSITYIDSTGAEVILEFNMTEGSIPANVDALMDKVYVKDGVGWDGSSYLTSRIDEFAFITDYLWKPLGLEGTYGVKDKLSQLGNAKTLLQNDKQKAEDSKTSLARFG